MLCPERQTGKLEAAALVLNECHLQVLELAVSVEQADFVPRRLRYTSLYGE